MLFNVMCVCVWWRSHIILRKSQQEAGAWKLGWFLMSQKPENINKSSLYAIQSDIDIICFLSPEGLGPQAGTGHVEPGA